MIYTVLCIAIYFTIIFVNVIRKKWSQHEGIRGPIYHEDITILDLHAPNCLKIYKEKN